MAPTLFVKQTVIILHVTKPWLLTPANNDCQNTENVKMIKRLGALFVALMIAGVAFAAPVSPAQARKVAERTLMNHGLFMPSNLQLIANAQESTNAKVKDCVPSAAYSEYYIFSDDESKGFVIVSGDDLLPSVIAYSSKSTISSADNMPPALKHFLNNYSRYVNDIRAGKFEAMPKTENDEEGVPVVDALCTTLWDQGDPYNSLCPVIGEQNSVVGCVATAMAQIMKYWNWPKQGKGKNSYVLSGYGLVSSDFSTHTYDWDNMCDTYPFRPKRTEAQRQAVALISSDCGVATNMDYSPSGSGTFGTNAKTAFVKYFGYAASKLQMRWRLEYTSPEEWFSIFKNEFDEGRPILMTAVSPIGSHDSGHAFVIDGYDTNSFVHVNWGWAGDGNGYYNLSLMDVSGSAYKEDQSIIFGLEPDYEGTDCEVEENQVPLMIRDKIAYEKIDKFDRVMLYGLANESPYMSSWIISASLCDLDGNEIRQLSTASIQNLRSHHYYEVFDLILPTLSPLSKLPAGDYGIRIFTREEGYEDWILPIVNGGLENNWIPVYFDGKKTYFNEVSTAIGEINANKNHTNISFNLSGQAVNDTYKGIVIRDGKKYLRK